MVYVDVAVAKAFTGGKTYSYTANDKVKIGAIVKIPFGKNIVWGVVVAIVKKPTFAVKEVIPYFGLCFTIGNITR